MGFETRLTTGLVKLIVSRSLKVNYREDKLQNPKENFACRLALADNVIPAQAASASLH